MKSYQASFNPQQFELRNYTGDYFTSDQLTSISQVESRVNAQLDWVGQLLGWSGPDYWSNLVSNVAQKRRLLGGSFGVYNSYYFPKVVAIRNWEYPEEQFTSSTYLAEQIYNTQDKLWVVLEKDEVLEAGQLLVIGNYSFEIEEILIEGERFVVPITGDVDEILSQYYNGSQVKILTEKVRPEPFYRPTVSSAGDASFTCKQVGNNTLELYPEWDSSYSLPYKSSVLMVGATYYFDKPVYLSRSITRDIDGDIIEYPIDLESVYDPDKEVWYLSIPDDFAAGEVGTRAYIVWLYANSSAESFCVKEVSLQRWVDPSDWGDISEFDRYTGTWGAKGGCLPFNFVFDSLEISGFDEQKSLILQPLTNRVSFDKLLNFVYYQQTPISPNPPTDAKESQVWWNSQTGSFSVWVDNPYGCGSWEEVLYPNPPVIKNEAEQIYPTVDDFRFSSDDVPVGVLIEIADITGLSLVDNVLGISSTLQSPASLKLYKEPNGDYWIPFEFTYQDEADFDADALALPYLVPVILLDSELLGIGRYNYVITNLGFVILEPLSVKLLKQNDSRSWTLEPISDLKYIGKTRLFASSPAPVDGAMNWNYLSDDEETRRAAIFYYNRYVYQSGQWVLQGDWVDVNTGEAVSPPQANLDFGVIKVYCDGELLTPGYSCYSEDYSLIYEIDAVTGEFVFDYQVFNFEGVAYRPKITISDSLTGAYTYDISEYVYSGMQLYMSPNVYDCETTLRLWKNQDLIVEGEKSYESFRTYSNILRADENNGPGSENWQRYFVRLPPTYERNGPTWQKVALVCQDFGYWGTSINPEQMQCPSEIQRPDIYEEVFLYRRDPSQVAYMYSEPYLYSQVLFGGTPDVADFGNSAILPAFDVKFDDFDEGELKSYEPLHERQVFFDKNVGQGYGDWQGVYVRSEDCKDISGFLTEDLLDEHVRPVDSPLWDASVYKLPISCEVDSTTYKVDANNYKVGYAYFVADLSCAEDGFFDPDQEASWREPITRGQTLYLTNSRKPFTPRRKEAHTDNPIVFVKTYGGIPIQQPTSTMGNWEVTDFDQLGLYGVTGIGHFDAYCVGYPLLNAYLQDPAYRQKIFDYLDNGGVLWYLGEYHPCTDTVLSNSNLELLGTTIRLGNDAIMSSYNVRVTDNPLFPVNFFTSATNSLTGGIALYKESASNKTVLAYEKIGNGVIVVSGDSNGTNKEPTPELYTALRSLV